MKIDDNGIAKLFTLRVPDYEGHRLELDKSLSWKDLEWLCKFTTLPVIAKGVQRADDALKAVEAGCKGILVSNHGARLVDTAPATVRRVLLTTTNV